MNTTNPEGLRERVYSLANHFDSMRKGLPVDWQDFAVEVSNELRHIVGELDALAAPINPVAVDSTLIGGAAAAGREDVLLSNLKYARSVISCLCEKAAGRGDREYCDRILHPGNSIDRVIAEAEAALSARPAAGDGEAVDRVALALYLRDGGSESVWRQAVKVYLREAYRGEARTAIDAMHAREGAPEGWKVEYAENNPSVMVITTPDQKAWITTEGERLFALGSALAAAPTAGEGSKDG